MRAAGHGLGGFCRRCPILFLDRGFKVCGLIVAAWLVCCMWELVSLLHWWQSCQNFAQWMCLTSREGGGTVSPLTPMTPEAVIVYLI